MSVLPFLIEPPTAAVWSFHLALMLLMLVSLLMVGFLYIFFKLLQDVDEKKIPNLGIPSSFLALSVVFWFGAESSERFPVGLAC